MLVRHGPVAIPRGVCYGRLDVAPLAVPAGLVERAAAEAAGGRVWTSPSRRCVVLAAAIAARLEASPGCDERLLELDFGLWEGVLWSEVPRAELDPWAADPARRAPPQGETGAALVARVGAFHRDLADTPGSHVVVSHGGPLRILSALLRGGPVDLLAQAPALGSIELIRR